MKFYILLIIFLSTIYGCSDSKRSNIVSTITRNNSEITKSFLNQLKADTVTLPLSSLVEGCELVQLEYTEEALFIPNNTIVTNDYIGVSQEVGSYKLFSRSGKFLCNVGSVGQGPGEYISINDGIIDEQNELIYLVPLLTGNKIFVYNTSGRFLKNIEVPRNMLSPILFLSNDILTVVYVLQTIDKSMATQINIHTGQVVSEFTTQISQHGRFGFRTSRNMQDIFDIVHGASDTIYHYDMSNYSLRPIFTTSDNFSEETIKRYIQLNKDFVLTIILHRGLVATDIKNQRSSWIKVKNDYFGNLDIPISTNSFRNGYYVYNIQPEQLMEVIEQRLTESNCTEKDRQILIETLSTLEENTNNVVFIGKLKNEVKAN